MVLAPVHPVLHQREQLKGGDGYPSLWQIWRGGIRRDGLHESQNLKPEIRPGTGGARPSGWGGESMSDRLAVRRLEVSLRELQKGRPVGSIAVRAVVVTKGNFARRQRRVGRGHFHRT